MNHDLKTNLREAYGRNAQNRDQTTKSAWKIEERLGFLRLLQQEHKHTLLELGAGTGQDGLFFREHGLEVTCTDLVPAMVELCRQKGLKAEVMDFAAIAFPAGSFDAVYALNSLLHLPKHELPAVLQAINTVLSPEGLCYIGVYGGRDQEGIWPEDPYEPQRFFVFYTDEHLQQAITPVFDVVSFKRIPLNEDSGALHFQSLILRKRDPTKNHSIMPS